MAPRTSECSASSARRTTSPYQRGKSSACRGSAALFIGSLLGCLLSRLGGRYGVLSDKRRERLSRDADERRLQVYRGMRPTQEPCALIHATHRSSRSDRAIAAGCEILDNPPPAVCSCNRREELGD